MKGEKNWLHFCITYFCHSLLHTQIFHLLTAGTCSHSENTNKQKGNRFQVERGAWERVRSCLSYLKFNTRKAKEHFLLLPCLLTVTFLLFHVPLWIRDLKLTALSWKFSTNFALLHYSNYKYFVILASLLSGRATPCRVNVPSSCLCGFKSGINY